MGPDEKGIVRASFFTGVVGGIIWYVLILFWKSLEFTSEEIGLMFAAGQIVTIATYLAGGYLADRLGRKRMLLLGLGADAIGLVMFLTGRNPIVFTAAYGLASMGSSLTWPALTAWMGDKASPANMKYLFGVQQFYNQVGLTIATFLGIFVPSVVADATGLDVTTGYLWVFLATAICAFIPIIFIWKISESKRAPTASYLASFDSKMRKSLIMYCGQNALIGAGAALVIPWFPVIFEYGMGASLSTVAIIITISNVAIAFGWLVVPRFANVRGSVLLITVCQLASIIPLILIPFSESWLVLVAGLYTLRSLLMLVPSPVLYSYLVNIVSEKIRASYLAWTQLAWTVAYMGGSAVAGYLWADEFTRKTPFYFCSALYIAGTLLFFGYFRNIKEPHEHASAVAERNEK